MSGEVFPPPRAPDKRAQPSGAMLAMPYPPETPPMLDPTMTRYPRLTPNLREMIHGFGQPTPDTGHMHDLLTSPDPTAMYNSMQIGSPILCDLYPQPSPMCATPAAFETAEASAERMERMAGACAEMNALFANYPSHPTDTGSRSDSNGDGVISIMSSPESGRASAEKDTNGGSISDNQTKRRSALSTPPQPSSQSSSQTPPPPDTSTSSGSPDLATTKGEVEEVKAKRPPLKPKKIASTEKPDKPKRPAKRVALKSQPKLAIPPPPTSIAAAAMAAANAVALNPTMAGLMPFACAMPPGMPPHMLPAPGTVHYQGRPMAFVAGTHGTELIPMDMLAQATAMQYGAAHAASQLMNSMSTPSTAPVRRHPPLESAGGSRKKRRRQLLERSGCSEEQARQNRAHALKRLREKKTLRSQQSTVRYACRKRIAMVRPRVNGRFATKEEVEECRQREE